MSSAIDSRHWMDPLLSSARDPTIIPGWSYISSIATWRMRTFHHTSESEEREPSTVSFDRKTYFNVSSSELPSTFDMISLQQGNINCGFSWRQLFSLKPHRRLLNQPYCSAKAFLCHKPGLVQLFSLAFKEVNVFYLAGINIT